MGYAALDVGRHRIGVAVAGPAGAGAYPLGTIERKSFHHDSKALAAMFDGRGVTTIIVGLPLNMDGSDGPAARSARAFSRRLAEALGIAVELFDERLTSFEARERMRGMDFGKGKRKPATDAIAAAVILEGWLQARPERV
ncbi:MAG TPA: Holliday junction resolvase RuvX [Candidatus Binataceae bacterium]|nr:Holliday junction resolvase RuvX [Candidatus Binataceae bacterium]